MLKTLLHVLFDTLASTRIETNSVIELRFVAPTVVQIGSKDIFCSLRVVRVRLGLIVLLDLAKRSCRMVAIACQAVIVCTLVAVSLAAARLVAHVIGALRVVRVCVVGVVALVGSLGLLWYQEMSRAVLGSLSRAYEVCYFQKSLPNLRHSKP